MSKLNKKQSIQLVRDLSSALINAKREELSEYDIGIDYTVKMDRIPLIGMRGILDQKEPVLFPILGIMTKQTVIDKRAVKLKISKITDWDLELLIKLNKSLNISTSSVPSENYIKDLPLMDEAFKKMILENPNRNEDDLEMPWGIITFKDICRELGYRGSDINLKDYWRENN